MTFRLFPTTHTFELTSAGDNIPSPGDQRPVILSGGGWQSLQRNREPLFQRTPEMGLSSHHPGK